MDPRTGSRFLLPLRGQLFDLSGEEGQAPRPGRSRGKRPLQGAQGRAPVDPPDPRRAPDQVQGADPQVRGTPGSAKPAQAGQGADRHPGARAAGQQGDRSQEHHQILRRQIAVREPVLHAAPGRHRRGDRAQWRGQIDAVQNPYRQGNARQRHRRNRRYGAPRLRRPEPRRSQSQEQRLGGNLRRP